MGGQCESTDDKTMFVPWLSLSTGKAGLQVEENGCRIMYFSPIHDSEIPHDADGVIFWGGYPERYAKELSENKSMIKSVKIKAQMPINASISSFIARIEPKR